MDKKDAIIKALKISNQERQRIIDDLLREDLTKHNVIENLRGQIKEAKFVIEHLAKR